MNQPEVIPQTIAQVVLDAMVDTGGFLDASTLRLQAAPLTPTPQTVIADMTPPTFTGYVAQAGMVFSSAYNIANGGAGALAPSVPFERTGGVVADTIYGWYLTNAAGTELRLVRMFDTPQTLGLVGDAVIVQCEVTYSGT